MIFIILPPRVIRTPGLCLFALSFFQIYVAFVVFVTDDICLSRQAPEQTGGHNVPADGIFCWWLNCKGLAHFGFSRSSVCVLSGGTYDALCVCACVLFCSSFPKMIFRECKMFSCPIPTGARTTKCLRSVALSLLFSLSLSFCLAASARLCSPLFSFLERHDSGVRQVRLPAEDQPRQPIHLGQAPPREGVLLLLFLLRLWGDLVSHLMLALPATCPTNLVVQQYAGTFCGFLNVSLPSSSSVVSLIMAP